MRNFGIALLAMFALVALGVCEPADAKRLGGGKSFGTQRPSATPAPSAPAAISPNTASQPVMPAQPGATLPGKATVPPAPAPSGMSRWLGPIAGIAAGLGLAALLSHFGLPEGFASILLLGLAIVAGIVLVRMLLRTRVPVKAPMQYAGAGAPDAARPDAVPPPAWGTAPADTMSTPSPLARKPLPPGFDGEGFLKEAKQQWARLQAAHDASDRAALSAVMTTEMYAEVAREMDTRDGHHATEIVSLNADLVEVVTEGDTHWASVRFTGLTREDGAELARPFDELWNLRKPVAGNSGWLVAGIQQLEPA